VHKVTVTLKKIKKLWTGWACHPVVICNKKWQPDDTPIRWFTFPKQNENQVKLIWLSYYQIEKTPRSPLTVPQTPNQLL